METQYLILDSAAILEEPVTVADELSWSKLSLLQRSQLLHQALEHLDDDLTDEEFDLIAESEQQFRQKLAACAHVAQKFDRAAETVLSEAEALKRQAQSLEQRAMVFANRAERRRIAIREAMLEHNLKKLETPTFTLTLRQSPPKVIQAPDVDLLALPEDYIRTKVEPNRRLIAQELKNGKAIPGFHLSEPEFSVRIR